MNTNLILKKVISNHQDYMRKRFANELLKNVDIENCQPIDFTYEKYVKREHENNLFLFITSDFRCAGILTGNKYNDKNRDFINVYNKYNYKEYPQNRKQLTGLAEYILMITPEMETRKKREKYIIKPISLRDRLMQYKKEKYNNITYEDIIKMLKDAIFLVTKNIGNKTYEETTISKLRDAYALYFHGKSIYEILKELSDYGYNIDYNYNQYKIFQKYNHLFNDDHNLNEYNIYKINLIRFIGILNSK